MFARMFPNTGTDTLARTRAPFVRSERVPTTAVSCGLLRGACSGTKNKPMKTTFLATLALVSGIASTIGCAADTDSQVDALEQEARGGRKTQLPPAPPPPAVPAPYQEPTPRFAFKWITSADCAVYPSFTGMYTRAPAGRVPAGAPDYYAYTAKPNSNPTLWICEPGLYIAQTLSSGQRTHVVSSKVDHATRTISVEMGFSTYKTEAKGGSGVYHTFVPASTGLNVCDATYTVAVRRTGTAWINYLPEFFTMSPCL
jgi:hypothetical protein